MIPQCKGKDLSKVPASKLWEEGWYASTKYDGHYIQIHKRDGVISLYTSGGKQFYHKYLIDSIGSLLIDYCNIVLEAEFIADTDGKLGNRGKAAVLTTYRTEFNKGILSNGNPNDKIVIFNVAKYMSINLYFINVLSMIRAFSEKSFYNIIIPEFIPCTLEEAKNKVKTLKKQGWEGLFLKHSTFTYEPGKRVNTAIKLKPRPTADLLCIDTTDGEGKYEGMIGSLVLKDSKGRVVNVGSGLSDKDRGKPAMDYIGKVIEIEYEQILDTYIQPTLPEGFLRLDKHKEDID